MFQKLQDYIEKLDIQSVSSERKEVLLPFVDYLQEKVNASATISLNFICTHNSRRSHLSQIWAQAMAHYFRVYEINSYSGGTSKTAVYPMILQVLEEAGFQSTQLSDEENAVYAVKFDADIHPVIAFSKMYDHPLNPVFGFAAVMTCSDADENCPFIPGTEKRIALNYEDPKIFDDSPMKHQKYEERSRQIATELLYVFSKIKKS